MWSVNSLEARWFFPGTILPEAEDWFASLGTPEAQPPRTDIYLLGTGNGMGLKLREGRMEAKKRTSSYGHMDFGAGIRGLVEGWLKWSFSAEKGMMTALLDDPHWISVEKTRRIFYYRLAADKNLVLSAPGRQIDAGGGLELAALRFDQQDWWTVGVEVFGPEEVLPDILGRILKRSKEKMGKFLLPGEYSFSYPSWLESSDWRNEKLGDETS